MRQRRHDDVLGHDLATFEHRGPHGGTVVLVHGIGVSSRTLRPLGRRLGSATSVVAPDLVGFGRSPRGREPLGVVEHAEVLAVLLDRLADERPLGQVLLVGHSMGAQVVTEVAVRRPDLCAGLVLLGPVTDPTARSVLRQGARLLRDVPREPWRGTVLQVREWLRTDPRWYLRTAWPMRDHRLGDVLARVQRPVLLVRGARDPVTTREHVQRLADRAPDARVLEVPGAAHLVVWSHAEAVAAACREHLRAVR